jgi:hypothetical protein
MSRPGLLNTLVFWLMLLAGTAVLAPSLVLPPWIERQAQLDLLAAHARHVKALQDDLAAARKQIEHLNSDPAYLLRLAAQDFGRSLHLPNVELIRIAPGVVHDASTESAGLEPEPAANEALPELGLFVQDALERYPQAQLFLSPTARPVIIGLGAALIVAAIVLLCLLERARPIAITPAE